MEDIWPQFHRLPKAIRDAVATPQALSTVDRLEQQYPSLDVASLIMRTMVKEFPANQLQAKVADEGQLDPTAAKSVVETLNANVFQSVGDYLGITLARPTPTAAVPTRPITPPPAPRPATPTQPLPPAATPVAAQPRPLTPPLISSLPPLPRPAQGDVAPTEHYSEDDDQEIAQQSRRVQNIAAATTTVDIDQLADQVMRQHNLAFREELLQKRAQSLLKARLKAIRDSDDTKAMLTRPPKVGGLGLDPDLASNVVASLDQVASTLTSRGAVRPPEPPAPIPPPPIPKVESVRPTPKPRLTRGLPPDNLPTTDATPEAVVKPSSVPPPPLHRPADIPPPPTAAVVTPAPRPATPPSPAPAPLVTRERQPERPAMADISRPAVQVMGPAGEMSSLTLVEFRRLGQGAADSARRLIEKFHHYQKESFALWAQAVNGWRQSEVHRIYLDMGRQSLEQGIPIAKVVQQRAAAGLPYLSEHEFSIVADFNRQLQL